MKEDTPRNDGDEESLVGALGSLPTEAEPSGELWPEIEAQLEPAAGVGADDAGLASAKPATLSSISYRPWLQAAAAIVIFMAGASSGLGRSRKKQ